MLFTVMWEDFSLFLSLYLSLFFSPISLRDTRTHTITHYVHSLPGTTKNNGTMQLFCGPGWRFWAEALPLTDWALWCCTPPKMSEVRRSTSSSYRPRSSWIKVGHYLIRLEQAKSKSATSKSKQSIEKISRGFLTVFVTKECLGFKRCERSPSLFTSG